MADFPAQAFGPWPRTQRHPIGPASHPHHRRPPCLGGPPASAGGWKRFPTSGQMPWVKPSFGLRPFAPWQDHDPGGCGTPAGRTGRRSRGRHPSIARPALLRFPPDRRPPPAPRGAHLAGVIGCFGLSPPPLGALLLLCGGLAAASPVYALPGGAFAPGAVARWPGATSRRSRGPCPPACLAGNPLVSQTTLHVQSNETGLPV